MWLVLEDNPGRTAAFAKAAEGCGGADSIRIWRIAAQMIHDLPGLLAHATLFSLDHDLYRQVEGDPDPGCGRDVANFLASQEPLCPVIIHSTNTDAAWGMHGELAAAGWEVELIHHCDEPGWIETRWLAMAQRLARSAASPAAQQAPRIAPGGDIAAPPRRMRGEGEMPTGTVRLHRVLRAPAERVYRAFLDAEALAKWLPPDGFTCKVHHLDARVGGTFRMSFANFATGDGHAFGGEYLELVPHERIRYTDKFDDPHLPGEILVTVLLAPVSCGTEVSIVQEGLPQVIPVERCYLGWQESLAQLARLVEPEIAG